MIDVLIQMAGLILCGIGWQLLKPAGLSPADTRKVLTNLVYNLLLPALVLLVLWQADLSTRPLLIAISAICGIATGFLLGFLSCRICHNSRAEAGALILAMAFPNATYLGLPVLEATFGTWARGIAIQYDLFACTPALFTVGILFAARMGNTGQSQASLLAGLLRIPPMWAAIVAVILNLANVPMPTVLQGLLELLGRGVVPLMLFSLGLSLQWSGSRWRLLPSLVPVVIISLFLVPAVVWGVAAILGLQGEILAAVVMEAAMPSMVLGIVLCDRFNLDAGLYAAAVTVTTALSMVTLPLWYGWLV
jgi:predicted permease